MTFNFLGLVAAISAFFAIWAGHVAVRKIEASSPSIWLPALIFVALGLLTEYVATLTNNLLLSAALGIFGITLLWDAIELTRQQNRVRKGHAPANPNNPRHAKILAEYPSANTQDLLKEG